MNIYEILNQIFRTVFNNDEIEVNPQTTANDVDGWDSLSHINLILAIETKFKIKFSHKELMKFRNVGDLINSIESKISGKAYYKCFLIQLNILFFFFLFLPFFIL